MLVNGVVCYGWYYTSVRIKMPSIENGDEESGQQTGKSDLFVLQHMNDMWSVHIVCQK